MACPYFIPRAIVNDGSWPHPSRLPLGAGWNGSCCASGRELPADDTLAREFCNLGHAVACPHLPRGRDWDAVRFSVASASAEQITLRYACELGHAPIEHGTMTYELIRECWRDQHPDDRVHRLATSYVHAYRARQSDTTI